MSSKRADSTENEIVPSPPPLDARQSEPTHATGRSGRQSTGLARGLTYLLGGHAASLALTFVTNVITTRAIGPAGRGEFAAVTASAAAFVLPVSLGIGVAGPILVGRHPQMARSITLIGCFSAGGTFLSMLCWSLYRSTDQQVFLSDLSLNLLLNGSVVSQIAGGALYGLGRIGQLAWLNLLLCLASSALQIAAVSFGFGATGMLIGAAVANAAFSVPLVYAVCRHARDSAALGDTLRKAVPMGIRAGASVWQQQLLQRGSVLWMVARGWSDAEIGVTSVAASIAEIGAIIPTHIAGITRSRVAQGVSTVVERRITDFVAVSAVLVYALLLFVGGPKLFVLMFGSGFERSWKLSLLILVGAVVTSSVTGRLSHAQGESGFPLSLILSGLVAIGIGILLALPLSSHFGVLGVVLTSTLTNVFYVILVLFVTRPKRSDSSRRRGAVE